MLISLRAKNCFVFDQDVELSMRANKRYTRFPGNVAGNDGMEILKSAVVLGPNNTGKTMLTRAVAAMRSIMLNKPFVLSPGFSAESQVCEMTICFLAKQPYSFEIHYNAELREFVFEELSVLDHDLHTAHPIYTRDHEHSRYYCEDKSIEVLLPVLSRDNILIYLLDPSQSRVLTKARDAIQAFAFGIDVITTERLSIRPTIRALKCEDTRSDVRDFVCRSDPSFVDFRYDENMRVSARIASRSSSEATRSINREEDDIATEVEEMLRLVSEYKDHVYPSWLGDSHGTRTMEALAGYVIWALRQGRVLVIDELDSGLHFRLTRSVIALFNNERNISGQLIATTHDVLLLDCRRLFRKDQIWFTDKDEETAYLYSLADFTARGDGVRETSDLVAKYKAGEFGALPEPDMFSLLENLSEPDNGEQTSTSTGRTRSPAQNLCDL